MHQALYRTFRPETFDEMLGQEHIVRILRNQLATGTVSHAYLFCGTRGTGKTTTARLLAKGLNCTGEGERPCGECEACKSIAAGTYIDVIEIDAASNNGVDNIRELRESVKYPPAVGPYKVYIIDEVHMLTTEAFNALLKTLEEPPAGVVFILASTEPQRIPQTILSRCLRLDFRRVSEQKMREGLRKICAKLGVKISEAALGLIAANADGSVRDALSLLDQCLSGGDKSISRKEVLDLLGTSGEEVFIELTDRVTNGETAEGLKLLSRVLDDGKDVRQLLRDWMEHYRDLLIAKYVDRPEDILNLSGENTERLKTQAASLSLAEIREGILELSKASSEAKWSTKPRVLLELALVKLSVGEEPAPVRTARPARVEDASAAEAKPAPAAPRPAADLEPAPKPANEPVPETVNETAPAAPSGEDPAALWAAVTSRAAKEHASLASLASVTEAAGLNANALSVRAVGPSASFMVDTYRGELESILASCAGRPLRLAVETKKDDGSSKKSAEEIAREIGTSLGLSVEIE